MRNSLKIFIYFILAGISADLYGATPVADFVTNSWSISPGETVQFQDLSLNSPTSWSWTFEDGIPSNSTVQNPTTQFFVPGVYSIQLIVTNTNGTDSISKTIFVAQKYNFCSENAISLTGIISNYSSPPGNNCQFLISPPCAQDITLSFTTCNIYCYVSPTSNDYDYLYVYDGDNTNAPLILSTTCNNIPPTVTGHSGKLLIYLMGYTQDSYFEASWTSSFIPTSPPNTTFYVSNPTPPLLSPVHFFDSSIVGTYGWFWNFGDGNYSVEQNPSHIYQTTGNYLVTFITAQCNGSDTATMNINVQQESTLQLSDTMFNSSVVCMDTLNTNLWIKNSGYGDLVFQFADSSGFPSWLTITPDSGTISPGDSLMLDVNFNSYSIQSGNYEANLNLQSNDTNNLQNILNFLFSVNGFSFPLFSDSCLSYDTIIQYTPKQKKLIVYNIGCDTLFVSSLQFTNPDYTANFLPVIVLPGDSVNLNITIVPTLSGNYNDSLFITTNSGVTIICLNATIIPAPVISTMNSFSHTIDACSNETNGTLILRNTGGSILHFYAMQADNYIGPPARIILMKDTSNILNSYSNLKSIIQSSQNNFSLVELTQLDSASLSGALASADIFIIPQTNINVNYLQNISPVLESFVRGGGTVIISGMHPGITDRALATDLIHGAFGEAYEYPPTIVYPDHPIIRGIGNYSTGYQSMQTLNLTDPDIIPILKTTLRNTDLLAYRNLERGKIIYYGFRYIFPLQSYHQILFNAIEYAMANEYWLIPDSVTNLDISPGDSIILHYKIDVKNLSSGNYSGTLNLYSSDPLHRIKQILTTLSVNQKPCAGFYYRSDSCNGKIDFIDKSINEPVTWNWNFGDGSTSTIQNPSHSYGSSGVYSVSLITCNLVSCDTTFLNVYPVFSPAPSCIPNSDLTISNTMRVTFNTLDYYPPILGRYQDFTCSSSTTLNAGKKYTLSAGGNTINGMLRAWIDYNNDGNFVNSEEVAWESGNSWEYYVGSVIIPHNAVTFTPLRMRLARGGNFNLRPQPCDTTPTNFYQDFTVFIVPDTINALATFTYSVIDSCRGIVQFNNQSANSSSYQWDFGDGETSTEVNPIHKFNSLTGSQNIISVSLKSMNTIGTNISLQTIQLDYYLPEISLQSSGSLILCPGNDVLLYPSTNYNISFPYWILNNTIIITPDSSFLLVDSAVSCQIVYTNVYGCIDTSAKIEVTEAPDFNIQATSATACSGDSIQLSGPLFMQTYNWSTGDSTSSIFATADGIYSLNIMVQPACNAYDTIQVQFNSPPQQNITSINDSIFANSGADFYQWYFNGNAIAGETSLSLQPMNTGYYYVVATDSSGCQITSDSIYYLYTFNIEPGRVKFSIFPNPTASALNINFSIQEQINLKITITTITGNIVLYGDKKGFSARNNRMVLNLELLPEGLYLLNVESESGIYHFPILILH